MTTYSYDRTAKAIRLTPKEIQRADSGYTVVVRPQADGGYMVAAVKVEGQNGLELGRSMTRFVDDQGQIPEAVKDVVRWMDKMGIPGDMGGASRERVASEQTYYEWLKARGYKLTPMQAADHRHFVAAALPIERGLNSLLDSFGKYNTFEAGRKFSQEELETLRSARRILELSIIPSGLIRIVKDDDDDVIE